MSDTIKNTPKKMMNRIVDASVPFDIEVMFVIPLAVEINIQINEAIIPGIDLGQ